MITSDPHNDDFWLACRYLLDDLTSTERELFEQRLVMDDGLLAEYERASVLSGGLGDLVLAEQLPAEAGPVGATQSALPAVALARQNPAAATGVRASRRRLFAGGLVAALLVAIAVSVTGRDSEALKTSVATSTAASAGAAQAEQELDAWLAAHEDVISLVAAPAVRDAGRSDVLFTSTEDFDVPSWMVAALVDDVEAASVPPQPET